MVEKPEFGFRFEVARLAVSPKLSPLVLCGSCRFEIGKRCSGSLKKNQASVVCCEDVVDRKAVVFGPKASVVLLVGKRFVGSPKVNVEMPGPSVAKKLC